jgi:diadenosine tetraphosphate (Ap4A) HIT family hydrolase
MRGPNADETPDDLRVLDAQAADGFLGRHPVRPGHACVIWKGRHVAEAVDEEYRPAKVYWFSPGNGVPHLDVHPVPRPLDDAQVGWPVEWDSAPEPFHFAATPAVPPPESAAAALRARLAG